MSYNYDRDSFYVRECYPKYYQYILDTLCDVKDKIHYISVSGTPGIGKSIFYIYFFHRFRKENPGATIITASFDKSRLVEECTVFYPDGSIKNFLKEIPYIPGAIHLYDGPPSQAPKHNKMICFSSPNAAWYQMVRKADYHTYVYMPLWTYLELVEASRTLDLNISENLIWENFNLFGGIARYCLSIKSDYVSTARAELLDECVAKINSFESIKDSLSGKLDLGAMVHRIFFFNPYPLNYRKFFYTFCSAQVSMQVELNILDKNETKRKELVEYLRGSPKCGVLLGWLFETYINDFLTTNSPIQLKLKSLKSDSYSDIVINFMNYTKAELDNTQSIDGYALIGNELYFIQTTLNYDHPVALQGLIKIIVKLGPDFVKKVKSKEVKVKLVFAVSSSMPNFTIQNITTQTLSMESNVDDIPSIGKKRKQYLLDAGIKTANDWVKMVSAKKFDVSKCSTTYLDNFIKLCDQQSNGIVLEDIPQYLYTAEVDYCSTKKSEIKQ